MKNPPLYHRVKIDKPYVPANATNIRATFARIRREQAEQEAAKPLNVRPLREVKAK